MSDPTEHITLDRDNLLRLADAMASAAPSSVESEPIWRLAFREGYDTALQAIRRIAAEMPSGILVSPKESE